MLKKIPPCSNEPGLQHNSWGFTANNAFPALMKWILYRPCNLALAGPVEKMCSRILGYAYREMHFPANDAD